MLQLDPRSTALVLIDVQKGILAMPMAPYTAQQVTAKAVTLAQHFRRIGAPVILVRVAFAADYADRPGHAGDVPMILPPGGLPADWAELAPELAATPQDVLITKRQWSAFYGTELDLQLRRRGMTHIVLGGLMTNFGVESTARDAFQHNYGVVIAEDAASSLDAELHRFAIEKILPRVAKISSSTEVIAALTVA